MASKDAITHYNTPGSFSDDQLIAYGHALNRRRQTPVLAGLGSFFTVYALGSVGLRNKFSRTILLSSLAAGALGYQAAGHAVRRSSSIFTKPVEDEQVITALVQRQAQHALSVQGFNQHVDIVGSSINGGMKGKPL